MGIEPLPQNLGEHVFDFFLRNKRQEWKEYRSEVTAFELRKNLPVL
ncbi:glutamine synthetase [Streptomyces canus]|nr:glutamine synthetase [Streptomyces canus]